MTFHNCLFIIHVVICVLCLYNANTVATGKQANSSLTVKDFSWKNCGPASDPVQVQGISVAQDPVPIPGNVTVGFSNSDTAAIPDDIFVAMTIEKKVAGFFVKIPCVEHYGSCNYTDVCTAWKKFCPQYFQKAGFPCVCPFPAGNYTLPPTNFNVTLSIPILVPGNYRVTADVRSSEYHVGCLQLIVDLTNTF